MSDTERLNQYEQIINKIVNTDEITIISHEKPDGDCLGSQLALGLGLKKIGKKVYLINKDNIPEQYLFLPGSNKISDCVSDTIANSLIIFIDCADIDRAGFKKELFNSRVIINIDHHISNTNFGTINLVESQAAASGEIIYTLLDKLKIDITPDMATCLYTAISTDTGSFVFSNTTSKTHLIASNLLNSGANHDSIRLNYYENKPKEGLLLLNKALQNLNFLENGKLAYMNLSLQDFIEVNASDADADGLISYIKALTGVEVAIFFREIETNVIKIGFRSKDWFDVNKLANIFGGGGHPRAAGATIRAELNKCISEVINEVLNELKTEDK